MHIEQSSDQLPSSIYRVKDIRKLEKKVIEECEFPEIKLMESAGSFAFEKIQKYWPHAQRILVFAGSGNNGGDAYIVARFAKREGLEVIVLQVGDVERLPPAAQQAMGWCREMDVAMRSFDEWFDWSADVIVDGLIGIGLEDTVRSGWNQAIDKINQSSAPVLSLDIPSGLHADKGVALGNAVRADVTTTFIALKQGLYLQDGPEFCGDIHCSKLAIPPNIFEGISPVADLAIIDALKKKCLKPRHRSAHKGEFGHLLVIGGDYGMSGAVRMAGEAALRVGAGLVSIATRPEHAVVISSCRPELMCHEAQSSSDIRHLLKRATVIVIGPGLGTSRWGQDLLEAAIEKEVPLIVDADALNLLSRNPVQCEHWILTPHVGEASRLLATDSASIQNDRIAAVRALQERYGGVCVLKGAGTLVYSGQGIPAFSTYGNPGMASGGMGDILTGIIAGLVAQGLSLHDAAKLGVCLHGASGDAVAKHHGERGMIASDILAELPRQANLKQTNYND